MNDWNMRYYRAFGLTIGSAFDLPELELCDAQSGESRRSVRPDVRIVPGTVNRPDPVSVLERLHEFSTSEQYLGLGGIGKFLIRDAGEVIVDLVEGFPEELASYALLGPVFATLLHARGAVILHGSALDVDGQAVVFVGDKGAGKSTTAGAFASAGHPLLTDDVVALTWGDDGRARIIPSFPSMKLTPAAIEAFGREHFNVLPPAPANLLKQRATPIGRHADRPVPLAAVFALERAGQGAHPGIVSLGAGEALKVLLANSYMMRYGRDAFAAPGAMARHMARCGAIVSSARVATLHVPGTVSELRHAVELVERAMAGLVDA